MHKFLKIFFGSALLGYFLATALFGFMFVGNVEPAEDVTWGTTFGHSQATSLGLDWEETYLALLDDLGLRHFRIPIYWDELEPEPGEFDFSKWDWQLDQLAQRGGEAVVVVGFKLPRWPECRIPDWAEDENGAPDEEALMRQIETVVERYKDHAAVKVWQVENEPLLVFGICPEADPDLLDREIALVRELDPSRPVMVTDTGEWSVWYEAGKRGDMIGSTLYRVIHDPKLGFVRYWFLNPTFYARKALVLSWWAPDVKVVISELQAEPWVEHPPISDWPLDYQYSTMSPELFREQMDFALRTGFDTFYLWGGEWLVWLREQGETEAWDHIKEML